MMRLRVGAQFFTVASLVATLGYLGWASVGLPSSTHLCDVPSPSDLTGAEGRRVEGRGEHSPARAPAPAHPQGPAGLLEIDFSCS